MICYVWEVPQRNIYSVQAAILNLDTIVDSLNIIDKSISGKDLADDAITADKIEEDVIDSTHIKNDSVGNEDLVVNSVSTTEIRDATIDSVDVANNGLSGSDLVNPLRAPTTDVYFQYYYGDGSNLTGVGSSAATGLTISAKVKEAGGISKGQPVYISGGVGQFPRVSLCDNTDSTKSEIIGMAGETKTFGQTILIRLSGEISGLDTDGTGVPGAAESWNDSTVLYMSTAGLLTSVSPTSGTIQHVATVSYAHGTVGKLIVLGGSHRHNTIGAATNTHITRRMGDNAGNTMMRWTDSDNVVVGSLDSDGYFNSTNNKEWSVPLPDYADTTASALDSTTVKPLADINGAKGMKKYLFVYGNLSTAADSTIWLSTFYSQDANPDSLILWLAESDSANSQFYAEVWSPDGTVLFQTGYLNAGTGATRKSFPFTSFATLDEYALVYRFVVLNSEDTIKVGQTYFLRN